MYLKNKIFILIGFCILNYANAQQSISGRIIDSTKTGIEFVTVAFLNPTDSLVVQSTLSDNKGQFTFSKLAYGEYLIKTIMVGFSEIVLPVMISNTTSIIPDIVLRTGSVNLNEITVSAIRKLVEFKNGNVTLNIEDSPLAQGNSAFDLLSRLPGVTVDENNAIAIQGKSGVKILIDDRLQQLSGTQLINLLKSINGINIEKIEVLKNPPLKYDASGTGGLINIRTKKVKLIGFSGSVNYNYSQGFYGYHNYDMSLNYRNKKIIFYSTLTADQQTTFHDHSFYNKVVSDTGTTILDQHMANIDGGYYFGGRMALDWLINPKNTIGFKCNTDVGVGYEKNVGNNYISNNDLGFTRLRFNSFNNNPWQYSNLNLNAQHLFDTLGSKLIFSMDFSPNFDLYSGTYDNWFLNNNDDEAIKPLFYVNSNVIKNDIYSSKLDLIKKIKRTLIFECGVKATSSNLSSNYDLHTMNNSTGEFVLDTAFTNAFTYKEKIFASYMNFTKQWQGFSAQAGVRAESTHIVAESKSKTIHYTRNYFNLFPAINLEYSKNENHIIQLSYNRRIDRPDYNSFNPFKNRASVFMSNMGNPDLLPEYSNSFELSHTFKGVLSNSFSYSIIDNFMIDLTIQNDSSKETTATIDNLTKADRYGYSIFFNNAVKKWWTVTLNGSASYLSCEGKLAGLDYKSSGYFYMASLTNEFLLNKIKLEFNAKYIGPRFNGIWKNGPRWGISLAVKKSFFNEKLNITAGLDDIFFTMIGSNQMRAQNQEWYISATNDSRRFKIGISFNFGKIKVEEREVSSNDEEKGRLGK